jgi:hypothetical protein
MATAATRREIWLKPKCHNRQVEQNFTEKNINVHLDNGTKVERETHKTRRAAESIDEILCKRPQ